jgi:hypothetical protein
MLAIPGLVQFLLSSSLFTFQLVNSFASSTSTSSVTASAFRVPVRSLLWLIQINQLFLSLFPFSIVVTVTVPIAVAVAVAGYSRH